METHGLGAAGGMGQAGTGDHSDGGRQEGGGSEQGMLPAVDPLEGLRDGMSKANFLSEADVDEWVADRVDQAKAIADKLAVVRDYIERLPLDREDARRRLARQRLCEIFGLPNDTQLSLTEFHAAVMLGRGLTFDEVAVALGTTTAEIYGMMTTDFRKVVRHWREQTLEEYFTVIIRRYHELLETVDDSNVMVKILRELRELAGYGENRRRWEAEFDLREREVAAKERDSDSFARQVGRWQLPPGAVDAIDVEVIDVEFEDSSEGTA